MALKQFQTQDGVQASSLSGTTDAITISSGVDQDHSWQFGLDGNLTLPENGDILDSNGVSVLSGGIQVDNKIWVETFATNQPDVDIVNISPSVEYDASGNIIALFSHHESVGNTNYTSLAKLSPAGTIIWKVRFAAASDTNGWGLAYDADNNVIYVAGQVSGSPFPYYHVTMMKINAMDGGVIWARTYDFGSDNNAPVIDVASDGHPVMVGYGTGSSDIYVATTKVNAADGSVLWSRKLDGQGNEYAKGMAVGNQGEVITVGYMNQYGLINTVDSLVTEPTSNVLWTTPGTTTVGEGNDFSADYIFVDGVPSFSNITDNLGNHYVGETIVTIPGSALGGADGVDDMIVKVNSVITGETTQRMLVVKHDSIGGIQWQKAIQFDEGFDCTGADADVDADGNIYVCGQYTYVKPDESTDTAMSLIKLNSDGDKQWSRRVVGNCETVATSVVVGDDGYLYLSGISGNNDTQDFTWAIAKYSPSGTVVWQRFLDNIAGWSFGGGAFFSNGGGSNIAVKNGYVALGGGYGLPWATINAVVAQVDTTARLFVVGDWDFKASSFSGVFDATASDILVTDANKTGTNIADTITVADQNFNANYDNFLFGTVRSPGGSTGDITFSGIKIIGDTTDSSLNAGGIKLIPNLDYEGTGQYLSIYPTNAQDAPHIHIAAGPGGDLLIGDDNSYMGVINDGNIKIGTGGNIWSFDSTGAINFPTLTVDLHNGGNQNGQVLQFGSDTQAIITGPTPTGDNSAQRLIIQGQRGSGIGEGGDVYVWAGDAATNGGDIKIYAGDADDTISGNGGYVNIDGGSGYSNGGGVNITGGASNTGTGGDVVLTAGNGSVDGLIRLESGAYSWTFDSSGAVLFPNNTLKCTNNLTLTTPNSIPSGISNIANSTGSWEANPATDLATTGGSGTGLTVNVIENGGYAATITIATPGSGYSNGDVITVTSGSSNAVFIIDVPAKSWTFGTNGTLSLPTGGSITYAPSTPSDWSGTPPTSIESAIDRLAAVIKVLNGDVGA